VNCAPGTLAKYAVIGGGPIFRRIGRFPLYAEDDLDRWITSKLSGPMRSTSDQPSPMHDTCPHADPQEHSDAAEKLTGRQGKGVT
jgi:hypothetical protein